jgi:hypothetical protein
MWPLHDLYAPEPSQQKNSREILAGHVCLRFGPPLSLIGLSIHAIRNRHHKFLPLTRGAFVGAGAGHAAGFALAWLVTEGYMFNKTEPEWQDRAWRVRRNVSQNDLDRWILAGYGTGAVWAGWDWWRTRGEALAPAKGMQRGALAPFNYRALGVLGRMGISSAVFVGAWGVVRYGMGWEVEVPEGDL